MNKNKIREAMPMVLFACGIAGIFVSEVMAARDTLKAEKILEENHIYREKHIIYDKPDENGVEGETVYTTFKEYVPEVVKATWKCYIPTAVATTVTLAALIASNRLTKRQIALLSSAVASGGALVQKYRKEILDRTNPEILSEIDKAVAKATMEDAKPVTISTQSINGEEREDFMASPSEGEVLFFDPFTGIKFRSSKLAVLGAKYYLNHNYSIGTGVPFAQFYEFLGLDLPEPFRQLGWEINDDGYMWIDIECIKSTEPDPETGEYYYIIEYPVEPTYPESTYPSGNLVNYIGSYAN